MPIFSISIVTFPKIISDILQTGSLEWLNPHQNMFIRCVFVLLFLLGLTFCQDCTPYGQNCYDDQSCCGGCCLGGKCLDVYLDCKKPGKDPCINRYCPEGQICVTSYRCVGCPVFAECTTKAVPDELKHNRTLTHHHRLDHTNSASIQSKTHTGLVVLIWGFISLIFL